MGVGVGVEVGGSGGDDLKAPGGWRSLKARCCRRHLRRRRRRRRRLGSDGALFCFGNAEYRSCYTVVVRIAAGEVGMRERACQKNQASEAEC